MALFPELEGCVKRADHGAALQKGDRRLFTRSSLTCAEGSFTAETPPLSSYSEMPTCEACGGEEFSRQDIGLFCVSCGTATAAGPDVTFDIGWDGNIDAQRIRALVTKDNKTKGNAAGKSTAKRKVNTQLRRYRIDHARSGLPFCDRLLSFVRSLVLAADVVAKTPNIPRDYQTRLLFHLGVWLADQGIAFRDKLPPKFPPYSL